MLEEHSQPGLGSWRKMEDRLGTAAAILEVVLVGKMLRLGSGSGIEATLREPVSSAFSLVM